MEKESKIVANGGFGIEGFGTDTPFVEKIDKIDPEFISNIPFENDNTTDPSNLTYYYESVGFTDKSSLKRTTFTEDDTRKNFITITNERFLCEFRGKGKTHRMEHGFYKKLRIKIYNFLYLEVKFYRFVEKTKYLK